MPTSRRHLACLALPALANLPAAGQSKLKIGTYDSRAIAVAYAASRFNPVAGKMKELQAARAAGDQVKVKELEQWGQARQRELHRQGFGRVPVNDLLAHVRDRLAEVAAASGVQAIAMQCDWVAPGTSVVDITGAIVALYDPSPRTLNIIRDLKNRPPLPLDKIEEHGH